MKFITALPMFAALTLLPPLFGAGGGTSEDEHYYCEYCGRHFPSIMLMTAAPCLNHPKGENEGNHSPAL